MSVPSIVLISFGGFEKALLDALVHTVSKEYQYPVLVRELHYDLNDYFDPGRRQYNGNQLLQVVEKLVGPPAVKTVGLFNVDLFIPILTYIFGQAILNGDCGIVSRYRLSNELYGLRHDEQVFRERLFKEVNHELGHCFGLIHCADVDCVMRSSTYVEDIDQKTERLCPACRERINR